jgi:hypothetical protein
MKRSVAAAASAMILGLAACGQAPEAAPEPKAALAEASAGPAVAVAATPPTPATTATGAPAYSEIYPGGQVQDGAGAASGASGPGRIVTFTTAAAPDQVVAFYKQRAEAAGLHSVMAMDQGDAKAYGAAGRNGSGASLQVVAAPTEGGETSVQLSWNAGQ